MIMFLLLLLSEIRKEAENERRSDGGVPRREEILETIHIHRPSRQGKKGIETEKNFEI